MFEKYIINGEPGNKVENGKITGFSVGAKLPYYRGLGISMVEDIQLTVDTTPVPPENIRVVLHGNSYTLAEMAKEPDDRWEFGEVGIIEVSQPGGLAAGKHTIEIMFTLRVSYMPVNAFRKGSKTFTV
jgi:Domain of unknown function (DUF6379)